MGSRFGDSGYGSSRPAGSYGQGDTPSGGMRSSDAAGGYRRPVDDAARYSRDSYVEDRARESNRDQDDYEQSFEGGERDVREGSLWRAASYRPSRSQQAPVERQDPESQPGPERLERRSRARAEIAARRAEREAVQGHETLAAREVAAASEETAGREGAIGDVLVAESRADDVRAHYSRSGGAYTAKKQGSAKRTAGIVVAVILVVALVGAGAAFAYFNGLIGKMNAGFDEEAQAQLVPTDMGKEPFYMLLLGTDKSAWREETDELDGIYRTDSMMLARVDPIAKKVTMVSIPRDTLVDLGEYGYQRINAAYAFGGPALAIKAVSELAGVNISHYAEIDFDGFAAMVDAVGGVEVDVPIDIDDDDAGGSVSAGLQTLNGEQALVLCRSRNAYAYTSAAPDLMRAANQRMVLSAIAHKLLASDIGTIAKTVGSIADYVVTDVQLNDIIGLAQIMQGLDSADDIYTASFPTESVYIANGLTFNAPTDTISTGTVDPGIDEGYYLLPDQDEWKAMKKRMDNGEPPSAGAIVDETTGTVLATAGADAKDTSDKYCTIVVKNATDIQGAATRTAKELGEAGFQRVTVGEITDGSKYAETLIVYNDPSKEREAKLIEETMGQGKAFLNDGSYLIETDFLIVIGDDWVAEDDS